jgi:hypothetical protein
MLTILFFMSLIFANQDSAEQNVQVYVDITEVHDPNGQSGTSMPLNILVSDIAQSTGILKHQIQYHSNPNRWQGDIRIFDWNNIKHIPNFQQCDYSDAISCGNVNNHWTLRTVVLVGEKYSTITMKLYNQQGLQIGHGQKTRWGTIRWKPRWKLTKVKEQGPFGGATKEIFEMWPPEMQEIPPLIRPFDVRQTMISTYFVDKSACTSINCK